MIISGHHHLKTLFSKKRLPSGTRLLTIHSYLSWKEWGNGSYFISLNLSHKNWSCYLYERQEKNHYKSSLLTRRRLLYCYTAINVIAHFIWQFQNKKCYFRLWSVKSDHKLLTLVLYFHFHSLNDKNIFHIIIWLKNISVWKWIQLILLTSKFTVALKFIHYLISTVILMQCTYTTSNFISIFCGKLIWNRCKNQCTHTVHVLNGLFSKVSATKYRPTTQSFTFKKSHIHVQLLWIDYLYFCEKSYEAYIAR